nr:hypothetical protein Itr_chr02CG07590 [Ipomoea trifida]GMC64023.1 hypothetical protein Iba_chr02dCG0960 [Ipomoea batatas]
MAELLRMVSCSDSISLRKVGSDGIRSWLCTLMRTLFSENITSISGAVLSSSTSEQSCPCSHKSSPAGEITLRLFTTVFSDLVFLACSRCFTFS